MWTEDQIALSTRMQKKIGMASIKSNFSNLTNMLKQIHSRCIPSKPKIQGKPKLKTLSALKTTRYHEILSPSKHSPLMCQTAMWNKCNYKDSGRRKWNGSTQNMDLIVSHTQSWTLSQMKERIIGTNISMRHLYELSKLLEVQTIIKF